MRNWKKVLVATVLGGACAMSLGLGAAACDTEEHTHSYDETAWVGNATQHWHPATCGDDTKGDAANHSDENGDGLCDVCGLGTTANHGHTYADVWSSDATNHWHAALCDHDVVADQAAHTLENGVCTVCKVAVGVDLSDALENIAENADKAKQMTGTYEYTVPARSLSTSVYNVTAEMHDDFTYTKSEGANFTEEYWYKLVGEDKDICYSLMGGTYNEEPVVNDGVYTVNNVEGYAFTNPMSPSDTFYGLEQFITGMYDYASFVEDLEIVETWVGKVETEANGTNAAVLGTNMGYSFGMMSEDDTVPYYFVVDVAFTVAEEGYVDSADISIVAYTSESLDEQGNLRPSYLTEVITVEEYSFTQSDEITVEEGETAVTMPVDTDTALVTDFKMSISGTDVTDNRITGQTPSAATSFWKNTTYTSLSVVSPETGDFGVERLTYTVEKYNPATEDYEESEDLTIQANYNSYDNSYNFNVGSGSVEGDYRITVSTTLVSKTFDFKVAYNPTTTISAQIPTGYPTSIYEGGSTRINLDPGTGCNPEMTIDITTTDGDATTATATYNTYNDYYEFTAAKAGTYVVKFTSVANNQATDEVTVTVNTPPEIADVLNGTYVNEAGYDYYDDVFVSFTPASEGALTGTFKYYIQTLFNGSFMGEMQYAYNSTTEAITLTGDLPEGLNSVSVSLSDMYVPVLSIVIPGSYGYDEYITVDEFEITEEAMPSGFRVVVEKELTDSDSGRSYTDENDTTVTISFFNYESASGNGYEGMLFLGSDQWTSTAYMYFSWTVNEDNTITLIANEVSEWDQEYFEALGEYADIITKEGVTATYDVEENSVTIGEITFGGSTSTPGGAL